MTGQEKLMVIGLEVGDGKLIREWASSGDLPVFASLIESGSWRWLDTTAEELHVSAWPSIYTGASPGEHGVYFTFQPAPGIQGYKRFETGLYGRPTFWKVLDDNGVRCTVLDAPYTHPEEGFSGTQIFDWGTWAKYLGASSIPPASVRRLGAKFGKDPIGLEAHDIGLQALDVEDVEQRLSKSVSARVDAALWLMDESPWDLFFLVFGEPHPAAHYCWFPPADAADGATGDVDSIRRIYQEMDRGLGKILQRLSEDTVLLVVSGDGVGPNYSGWHLMPEVLRRAGFLAEPSSDDSEAPQQATPKQGFDPVKALRDLLPKDFRKALARRLPRGLRDKLAQRVDTATIDWSKTRAYCLPTDLEGCIRINLQGREPEGIVSPGEDYETVCAELTTTLKQLVHPTSGRPAVERVLRTDEVFPGPKQSHLPDLIVLWSGEEETTEVVSEELGSITAESPDGRPGTHCPPGFLLSHGSPSDSGGDSPDAHIYDVAPTVLSWFGIPAPPHMSGKSVLDSAKNL